MSALLPLTGCSSSGKTNVTSFCQHYRAAAEAGATLTAVDTVSLDEFKARITTVAREADAAAAAAPDEVRDATKHLAKATDTLRTAGEAAADRSALEAAVHAYAADVSARRAEADQLTTWARQHCGLTTVASPTTTIAGAPTPSAP